MKFEEEGKFFSRKLIKVLGVEKFIGGFDASC